jgi:hypothetical protein
VLSQLRADQDAGLLPLLVIAPSGRDALLQRAVGRHRNAWILPEVVVAKNPEEFKTRLEESIKLAAMPDTALRAARAQQIPGESGTWPARRLGEQKPPEVRYRSWLDEAALTAQGQKLTAEERKQFSGAAMDALWRMARGMIKGYDVRPAEQTIVDALNNEDLAVPAIEILMTLPGSDTQQRLAGLVLDPKRGKLRISAAAALNRHVQHHGLSLGNNQLKLLREAFAAPDTDPILRAQLAVLMGSVRGTAAQTGGQLYRFQRIDPPP